MRMNLCNFLSESGVDFELVMHPQAFTAQRVAEVEHVSGHRVAKTVIACDEQGRYYMFVLPAPLHVDFTRASELVGAELRMADEEEMKELFPDCEIGAEPPFGSLYDVPTYIDRSLMDVARLIFRCGSHDKTVEMGREDYMAIEKPEPADFCIEADPAD
jgi:Ala-tRNA(Pro) deacylase